MNELFQAVRESCTPSVWSKGIEIARKDSVTGDAASDDEVVLRVATDSGVNPTVRLFPNDLDWVCNCNSDEDPCRHVAAAVIAMRRAQEQGQELPKSKHAAAKLAHALVKTKDGLALERWVASDDGRREKLELSLTALASGRVKGPSLTATKEDMQVELALQGSLRGAIPTKLMPAFLKALSAVENVTLSGEPVRISAEGVGVRCVVEDDGPGVRVKGKQDERIKEIFPNGAALTQERGDAVLHPVVLPQLDPREAELMRSGRFFGKQEFAELVAQILPSLESKMQVEVRSQQLPRKTQGKPHLDLSVTEQARGTMLVSPRIAYGNERDGLHAVVEQGRFVTFGSVVPVRDIDEERRLRDEIRRSLDLELDVRITVNGEAAVRFLEKLKRWEAVGHGSLSGGGLSKFALAAPLVPSLSIRPDGFALSFAANVPLSNDEHERGSGRNVAAADPESVFRAWREGASLVPLLDGGYAPLPKDWLSRHGDRLSEFLAAREIVKDANDAHVTLPRALLPSLVELAEDLGQDVPDSLAALRKRLTDDADAASHFVMPRDLTASLRPYQEEGVRRLAQIRDLEMGALLADDMGLGKTLQAICLLEAPALVVAPTSVTHNWVSEIRKFRPNLKVSLFHGTGRTFDSSADVVITTYALMRIEREKLAARPWNVLVLDEAQTIKNPASQAAKAARSLPAQFRLALSGTPVENRLDDLWSQMQFLNPGLLGDQRAFNEGYARRIEAGDATVAERLRRRIKPFVLRRLKRDVARDLPPRTDTVLYVDLSPEERLQYETILAATRADVMQRFAEGGSVIEALEALLRLRQACCHAALVPGSTAHASAKLELLVEKLQEVLAEGHKALVFSQWTSLLDLMEPSLACAGIAHLRLDGATKDRQAVVESFQAESGPPVLIMSLKAGGVGLNLTAADHVFIVDPWWNPAAEDQAADRAHRIGQNRPVLVHKLVALQTVEEQILKLQEKKRQLAAAVTETQGASVALTLTRDELLGLFDA